MPKTQQASLKAMPEHTQAVTLDERKNFLYIFPTIVAPKSSSGLPGRGGGLLVSR
ncbi:MAG: hypothetical protein LBT62_04260 [Deltaproteobacteria bacterium]|nr:hypothetical protein [Deltaproteobacteria bacterium]